MSQTSFVDLLRGASPGPSNRTCQMAAARIEALEAALRAAEKGFDRIHNALLSNGPKQACGEMALHFLTETRAAISQMESKQ